MGPDQPGNRERAVKAGLTISRNLCATGLIAVAWALALGLSAYGQCAMGCAVPGDVKKDKLTLMGSTWNRCERLLERSSSHAAGILRGCVRGADQSAGSVGVRISQVRSALIANTSADKSGAFTFKHVPAGEYVLLATQDHKVLGLRSISVPASPPIVMNIKPVEIVVPQVEY